MPQKPKPPQTPQPPQTPVSPATKPSYEVGYGRPPTRTRFVKGKSGNPRGRKKKKRIEHIGALLNEILDEEVVVRDGNRTRKMTTLEAMLHAQRMSALNGDPRATLAFFRLANKSGMVNPPRAYESNLILTGPDGDLGRILRMYHRDQEARRETVKSSLAMSPIQVKPAD